MKFPALRGKRGKITPKRRDYGSQQVAGCKLLSLPPANPFEIGEWDGYGFRGGKWKAIR